MKVTVDISNCYECPHCDKDPREPDCCRKAASESGKSIYDFETPLAGIALWCPEREKSKLSKFVVEERKKAVKISQMYEDNGYVDFVD